MFSDASDDRASNDRDRAGEWQMVQSSVSHSANTAQYLTSHKSAGLLNFVTDTVATTSWITMDSEDGLKTIRLFLNIFFYFLPVAALCDDFSLVDIVET